MTTTPKYRTDTRACSCPGFWFRRTCRHYRAYRDAVVLVLEQDKANKAFSSQEVTVCLLGERLMRHRVPVYGVLPRESGNRCRFPMLHPVQLAGLLCWL